MSPADVDHDSWSIAWPHYKRTVRLNRKCLIWRDPTIQTEWAWHLLCCGWGDLCCPTQFFFFISWLFPVAYEAYENSCIRGKRQPVWPREIHLLLRCSAVGNFKRMVDRCALFHKMLWLATFCIPFKGVSAKIVIPKQISLQMTSVSSVWDPLKLGEAVLGKWNIRLNL